MPTRRGKQRHCGLDTESLLNKQKAQLLAVPLSLNTEDDLKN